MELKQLSVGDQFYIIGHYPRVLYIIVNRRNKGPHGVLKCAPLGKLHGFYFNGDTLIIQIPNIKK